VTNSFRTAITRRFIHADYHRPSDTADKINIPGMRKIVDMSEDVVQYLATVAERPDYVADKLGSGRPGADDGPRLGIRPNRDDTKDGVEIGTLYDDYPAAKAGLKVGDRIMELAGQKLKNYQTYLDVMNSQKKGTTIEAVIERDGKQMTVKIKLE
jgi:S1-C subfamily serine protease